MLDILGYSVGLQYCDWHNKEVFILLNYCLLLCLFVQNYDTSIYNYAMLVLQMYQVIVIGYFKLATSVSRISVHKCRYDVTCNCLMHRRSSRSRPFGRPIVVLSHGR